MNYRGCMEFCGGLSSSGEDMYYMHRDLQLARLDGFSQTIGWSTAFIHPFVKTSLRK